MKKLFWKIFNAIDERLKFPALQKGETAIQLGFDMSAPVTSDLFLLVNRVGKNGLVIGIDPDPRNVAAAHLIVERQKYPIQLIHKAVFNTSGTMELILGEKASWNQLKNVPLDTTVSYNGSEVVVEMDTLDNILSKSKIDIATIGHINVTINGAEYFALQGMHQILSQSKNLSLTVVAGRYDDSGTINGQPDFKVIKQLLQQYGFKTRFRRIHKLIWWGFIVNTLMKRRWIYGKKNYGIIMAAKGNKSIPWYQSFS